jgi:AcrR family transcriptional regulator
MTGVTKHHPAHQARPAASALPSLRQRKKLQTRARIIEVAIHIFGKRGMTAPTVEEIAAAAEVGKGTIYNYFASKEEIVVAFMVQLEARVQLKVAHISRSRGPAETILADYIRYQLRLKEPYRDFVRVFMAQLYTRGFELAPHFVEMQKAINPPLLDLFGTLIQRGLIRPDVHLTSLLEIFKLLHIGIITIWINDAPPYAETMQLLDEEMRLFCRGLGPAASGVAAPIESSSEN